MKKFTLGMLALGSLVLTGCSSDETVEPDNGTARTFAVYNPATGDVPLPNDLLFSGTADLTLNVPVADPSDYTDPLNAVSALDGWSTVAPISVSFFNEDATVTLDATSIAAGQTVHLLEVMADTDYFNPLNGVSPTFAPYGLVGLVPANEYFATAQGSTLAILPLKPLSPRSTYVVIVTKGVMDSNGESVLEDGIYQLASSDVDTSNQALVPVQTLVRIYENLAVAGLGIAKDDIAVSFAFTTQSVGNVLGSAKAFYADFGIRYFDPTGNTPGFPTTPQYPSTSFSSLMTSTLPFTQVGAANLYKGSLQLNYLLETPTQENPFGPIRGFWKGADMVPDGQGGMMQNPLAGGHVTYVNSLPGVNSVEQAPLMLSVPNEAFNHPTYGACTKPAEGWPVMIFQHGITGNRTQMLALADTMAAAPTCTAVVAMDLPLHGIGADNAVHQGLQAASNGLLGIFEGYTPGAVRERTFGVDYVDNTSSLPGEDGNVDSSGAHFINLQSLLTSRDNLRQGVLDLLTLKNAIPAMDYDNDATPDFNMNRVSFFGISLGGIVGSNFVAYNDDVANIAAPQLVTSPALQSSVLSVPGGGIAGLLDASQTFGPTVRAGVAAGLGVSTDSAEFAAAYPQFLFAAQTVVDSGDPINTTSVAVANDIPTLLMRVEGDTVVPNNSPTAPLSGTDPLAAYLNLTLVQATNAGETVVGTRLLSRYNQGTHGTILSNDVPTAGASMRTQTASFIYSGGQAVVVDDPTLLD
ncbi:MAG: hypothetical protein HWE13_16010 [Gammaproteobacteria bacterium]|nr:hypothetical protein [Gammaproteobacteria bacterium]NVK89644.1 hypothetical protein [Gammaproteobacteria bacterium]